MCVETKEAMINTAARLFQRQGYAATGLLQIVEDSGTSRGSIYFHFRDGKEEIGIEAVAVAGGWIDDHIARAAGRTDTAGDFVRSLGRQQARWLETSGYVDGDPIAMIALEQSAVNERVRRACVDVFDRWRRQIGAVLVERGISSQIAVDLAQVVLAYQEGGLLLARTTQSTKTFRRGLEAIAALVDARATASPTRTT